MSWKLGLQFPLEESGYSLAYSSVGGGWSEGSPGLEKSKGTLGQLRGKQRLTHWDARWQVPSWEVQISATPGIY